MKIYWYFLFPLFFLLSQATVFSRNFYSPYPIIFVHGLNDNYSTWMKDGADNDVFDYLEKAGYVNGGRLDVTLDYLRDTVSLINSKEQDVHLFPLNNIKADFYSLNFCVHSSGSLPSDIPGFAINKAAVATPVVSSTDVKIGVTIPVQFIIGDIIRIGDEFMKVTDIGGSYISVDRHILGSKAEDHYISNEVWNLSTESNQASIAKQGYGLKKAIEEVKRITGAKKVILVGHSMGGLAIREYLRTYYNSDVAKVVTIGTPHLGSNAAEITDAFPYYLGIDVRSDAIRDLSYNYNGSFGNPNPTFESDMGNSNYLFGGYEQNLQNGTEFYSYDVNGNGVRDDSYINGIYNDPASFPAGVSYSWVVSQLRNLLVDGDGVVRLQRQFPWTQKMNGSPFIEVGDTLMTNIFHSDETKDYNSLLRGLDEPDNISLAYEIGSSTVLKGFITVQTNSYSEDQDVYRISLSKSGFLSINVIDIFQSGVEKIELLDRNGDLLFHSRFGDYQTDISKYLTAGIYFFRVTGKAKSNAYANPYTITTNFNESEVEIEGILKLEYFIDSDPGFGKGTVSNITSSSNIVANLNIPLTDVSDGIHTLFVRVKDGKNRWSIPQNIPFLKLKIVSKTISQLEYYLDTDPGFGKAASVPIASGMNVSKNFNIDLRNVTNGFHTMYIRAKDASGRWSLVSVNPFYRLQKGEIKELEYYLDTDPGFGKAASVPIASGMNVSKNFNIDLRNVTNGFHTMNIRAKDASGGWSFVSVNPFYRLQKCQIKELEYYFNIDPGLGFRSIVAIDPASSDITKQFNVNLACLSSGDHTFYVRAKDDLSNQSILYSSNITVRTVAPMITQNGYALHSNALSGNQWFNQDGAIVGATNQDYVVTKDGDYYVVVTHSGCSSENSNTINILNTDFDSQEISNSIIIYPNPVTESFYVNGFIGIATLKLIDIGGKEVFVKQISDSESISISSLPKGIYIVKLITANGVVERKLLKI